MGRVRVKGAGSVRESRSGSERCGFRAPAVYPPSASPATKHSFPENRRDEALSFVTRENSRFTDRPRFANETKISHRWRERA